MSDNRRAPARHGLTPAGQGRLVNPAAAPANPGVQPIFRDHGLNVGQLNDLMPPTQPVRLDRAAASATWFRMTMVRAADLFFRQQLTCATDMARLPTCFPAAGSMRLGCLPFPLIRRGRLRRVARIGVEFFFQHLDSLFLLAQHRPQDVDEGLRFLQRPYLRRRLGQINFHADLIRLDSAQFPLFGANHAKLAANASCQEILAISIHA